MVLSLEQRKTDWGATQKEEVEYETDLDRKIQMICRAPCIYYGDEIGLSAGR